MSEQVRWMPVGAALLACLLPGVAAAVTASDPPELSWVLIRHATPPVLWPGRMTTVRVAVRNVGTDTWSEDTKDHFSYHWRSKDGDLVVLDGKRTVLTRPVAPGDDIVLAARLLTPSEPGRWVLEWAMVREQVRWYPEPESGAGVQVKVRVWWRFAVNQAAFLLLTLGVVVLLRRTANGPWSWVLGSLVPPLWAWIGVAVVASGFMELAELGPAPDARWLGVAGGGLAALGVALVPVRMRAMAAGIILAVVTFLALADVIHLRFFGALLPLEAVFAWRQVGQIQDSILSLLRARDVWFLPGLAACVVLAWAGPRRAPAGARGPARVTMSVGVVVLILAGVAPLALALHSGWNDRRFRDQVFHQQQALKRMGWLGTHAMDFLRVVQDRWGREPFTRADEERLREFLGRRHAWMAAQDHRFGYARDANLVVIQAESLHLWVIHAEVNGQQVTPFLNGLSQQGLFFSQISDQSAQGRTSDGEFAALNSQHPLPRGALVFRRPGNRFIALPRVLQEVGYTTLSAHAYDRGFWNRAVVHPRYGFERSLFRRELGPGEIIGWGLADHLFLQRMVPHLVELPRPFFALLITLGLHHPFDAFPTHLRKLDVGNLEDTPLGNYLHAMHYLDHSLGEFFGSLGDVGLLDNTVVALYGDHESGLRMDDEQVQRVAQVGGWSAATRARLRRVPFFVVLPGGDLSGEVPTLGGHIDIAPTLLHLLGIRSPMGFTGTPLIPGRPFPAVLTDGTAIGEDRLLARAVGLPPDGVCYALPAGHHLPVAACGELRRAADEELWASRTVVTRDLAWDLARGTLP